MKKGKRLLMLVAGIAVFVAGAYLLKGFNDAKKAEGTKTEEKPVVLTLDKEGISEIAYTNAGETLSFKKVDGKWQYASDTAFPLKESQITAMADALSKVTASRQVADTLDKAEEYGLKEPSLSVWATGADGKKSTLYFGNKNSVTGDTYIYLDGSQTVYTVASTLPSKFNYKLYSLIADEAFPTIDASLISKLNLAAQDKNLTLTNFPKGSEASYSSLYTWFAGNEAGGLTPLDSDKVSTYLEGITGITITSTVDYDAAAEELAAYGLDTPTAAITVGYSVARQESMPKATPEATPVLTPDASVTAAPSASLVTAATAAITAEATPVPTLEMETITVYDPKQLTISLGNRAEDGGYYMCHTDSKRVFEISADTYVKLTALALNDLKPTQFCLIPIDTVNGLDVTIGGSTTHFAIERTQTTDADGKTATDTVYKRDGAEVGESAFKSFYTSLVSLENEKTATQAPSVQPYMTVTFHRSTENFKEMTLTLYPYDSSFYMADFNGDTGMLVNKRTIEALVKDMEALKD